MAEDKSVFERLEDIEKTLKQNEEKKITVSSLIGEPFEPYFNSSTIYYYESNERKFKKHKKTQCQKLIFITILYLIPIIFHIIISFMFKINIALLFLGDIILLLSSIFYLIYGLKQKSKKLANSKWNIKNHIFYVYDNKLEEENNFSLLGKFMLIYKLIAFIVFGILSFLLIFKEYDNSLKSMIGWPQFYFFLVVFFTQITFLEYSEYHYPFYMFDNKDSYVLYSYRIWEKFEK